MSLKEQKYLEEIKHQQFIAGAKTFNLKRTFIKIVQKK